MTTATRPVTADELFRMPERGCRYELIAGELRKMTPAGSEHGATVVRLTSPLGSYVDRHDLGAVFAAETGFLLSTDPDTVRAPDIAFVRKARIPTEGIPKTFWPGAPDLAVEVLSPRDTISDVDDKVETWLAAGTAMVWVVNPRWRTITVYRSARDITTLTENEVLDGREVVPGFQCRVGDVFVPAST